MLVFLPDACRYEPKAYLLGKEYFLHAYGPIYALSADVVNIINSIPDGRYVHYSTLAPLVGTLLSRLVALAHIICY